MRYLLSIITISVLTCACRKEEPLLNNAPPIAGFAALTQSFQADTETEVVLYLNKPVSAPLRLNVAAGATAVRGRDYELSDDGAFLLQPGATEAYLKVTPLPDQTELEDKTLTLTLQPTDGITLAEGRTTLTLLFLDVVHTVQLSLWAKDVAFPQLFGYTSFNAGPVPDGRGPSAGEHFCFAYKSAVALNVIGFYSADTTASTNAFNMHRIYADYNVTSASARIRIPQALRFIPDAPGARTGNVEVIDQTVTIRRTASSGLPPFDISIWGSGRYNEITGIISFDVHFDERAIEGPADVLRKYIYEKERRPG